MMGMAMPNGLRTTSVTITNNRTRVGEIIADLLSALPAFEIAFAYKDIDYSVAPTTNYALVELCGADSNYQSAVRYRTDTQKYEQTQPTATYSGSALIGDKYIIVYK